MRDPRADMDRVREFFGPRAHTWDDRFPDDGPAFAAAVAALQLPVGGAALDAGCGTGRALASLRDAVGASGTVVALDATPEMLTVAQRVARAHFAALVLADANRLPFPRRVFDGVLAAGLITHLADPRDWLRAVAELTRVGGRLSLFHPVGRAVLADRHGHALRADDIRAPRNVAIALESTGWKLVEVDDSESRYLAVARRVNRDPV
jgi:SAM-dependent methyltransferase